MKWRYVLAILGIVSIALGALTIDQYPVGVFHDDAMYLVLARALATGQGYRWINLPGAPIASHFPPGYPLVLSVLWRAWPVFPDNVVLFKAFNVACFGATVVLAAQLARETFQSERWGAVVGMLALLGVPLLVLVTMVLSEPFFLVLALLALVLGERQLRAGESLRDALVCGLVIGAAMLVRAHGIVLAVAFLAVLIKRGRWRSAGASALGVLLVVAPWQLWAAMHQAPLAPPLAGNYGSYTAWWMRGFHDMGFAMIPATFRRTALETSSMLVALFSPGRSALLHVVTLVALGIAISAGADTAARRFPLTGLFLAGYATIVLLWPFPPSRFVWGVWPLFLLLLVSALWIGLRADAFPRAVRTVVLLSCAWLACGYAQYEVRAASGRWWGSISRGASDRINGAVGWVSAHTAPGDLVSADDEGAIFLYTGRRALPVASFSTGHYLTSRSAVTEANEGLVPLIARYPVRFVIVGSSKSFEAAEWLASKQDPALAPLEGFPSGAAFTVLKQ